MPVPDAHVFSSQAPSRIPPDRLFLQREQRPVDFPIQNVVIGERIFPMVRQTVNRHIHALVKRVGGAPFRISAHTFRHSFAIHLLLHGRPLKYVSQLLGHRSVDSTEIYTNVLTVDGAHFLDGVDFH